MPGDRKLVHAVEKALAENEETARLARLHISAVAGVVFVDGEVDSIEEKDAVVRVAKEIQGVRLVRDRLQINPQARGGGWQQPHLHEE